MRRALLATSCVLLSGLAVTQAQAQTKPGLYESTTTMNLPGAPAPRTITSSRCITPEEAKDPGSSFSKSMQQAPNCSIVKKDVSGGHFTADMVCTGEQTSTSHMDFTFAETSMQGNMTMTMKMPQMPQPMTMTMLIKATRKGDCPN